jgi:F-type H+-transporting ATPase subunit gamma
MKMVSAAKLRRAQENAEAARPYALKMEQVISSLVSRVDEGSHPLLVSPEPQNKELVIVITSNRGLCGGYNSNVLRTLERFIKDQGHSDVEIDIVTVGTKGETYARSRELNKVEDFSHVVGNVSFANAKEIATWATERFIGGEYDKVHLLYNEFVSAIQYNTILQLLLPLSLDEAVGDADDDASEYIFEPDEQSLLGHLLPAHIDVQVLRALLEAEASEHGSRMTAMDSATNNAKDMIDSLTLQYNRARQAYITKELVEIVSGAEALKG